MNSKTYTRRITATSLFPNHSRLSSEEIAKHKACEQEFAQRCREIFKQVYPKLIKEHYNWFIHIEPETGDYFIAEDEEVSFQKAREKHPTADLMAMRLNETGTCGRI